MKILILENLELDGRKFTKGSVVLLGSDDAGKAIATGKATKEETDRSIGLKTSDVATLSKRRKK